jgi:DNA-directed RNA polymerase specialized sigma24 family protein
VERTMYTRAHEDWLTTLARESLGDFTLTRQLDADLSDQAMRAKSDPDARDALFRLLSWKINRFCSRFRRWNLRPWEFEDVRQEAYLTFVSVLNGWRPIPGTDQPTGFGFYFLRVFPLRLSDRVVRITGTRRNRLNPTTWDSERDNRLDPDDLERDVASLAFIIELSARLDPTDARIVALRAVDLAPETIAAETGISRRTFYRRWKGIADTIRREAG